MNLTEAIKTYITLRARKSIITKKQKDDTAPINEILAKLDGFILKELGDLQSAKVDGVGTAFKNKVQAISIEDPEVFKEFILATDSWGLVKLDINKDAAKEYLEDNKALPPGTKMYSEIKVGIRAAATKSAKKGE